jgi:hypothetical protein
VDDYIALEQLFSGVTTNKFAGSIASFFAPNSSTEVFVIRLVLPNSEAQQPKKRVVIFFLCS